MSYEAVRPIIDPEFKALIPPLRPDERSGLEAKLLVEGCRDALLAWQSADGLVLIDGHNRLEICEAHSLPYRIEKVECSDRLAVRIWIRRNALDRRNLTDDQRTMQAVGLQKDLSDVAKRERAEVGRAAGGKRRPDEDRLPPPSGGKRSEEPSAPVAQSVPATAPKRDTRQEAAEATGVSRKAVEKGQAVAAASPALAASVAAGTISLAEAVRTVKRAATIEKLESVEAREAKAAAGVYDVIVLDPPWPMEKIERDERPNQVAFDYPTMSEPEMAALTVPTADDAHVWVWTTHKFLPMALRLIEAWGLRYVCTFTWHKPGGYQPIGLPQYNCEFALYARKGSPKFIDTKAFPVCFTAPRGAHSEKPEAFYDVVRRVTAGRRLDMFNRRAIDGFDGWGKEAA